MTVFLGPKCPKLEKIQQIYLLTSTTSVSNASTKSLSNSLSFTKHKTWEDVPAAILEAIQQASLLIDVLGCLMSYLSKSRTPFFISYSVCSSFPVEKLPIILIEGIYRPLYWSFAYLKNIGSTPVLITRSILDFGPSHM